MKRHGVDDYAPRATEGNEGARCAAQKRRRWANRRTLSLFLEDEYRNAHLGLTSSLLPCVMKTLRCGAAKLGVLNKGQKESPRPKNETITII